MSGHGHVTPNADGSRARCGGPAICGECALEAQAKLAAEASTLYDAKPAEVVGLFDKPIMAALANVKSKIHGVRCEIVVRGGRDNSGSPDTPGGTIPPSRGQDIAVLARLDTGQLIRLPVTSLTLRVTDRKTFATVELIVDEVDVTGLETKVKL